MAENIHELWAMDKIGLGWTHGPVRKGKRQHYGLTGPLASVLLAAEQKKSSNNLILWQVKDEVKRHDPCLVEFAKLSEEERSQNLQMAEDTFR